MNWYLKTNNTTYGPVEPAVLQRWAMDGRVTPEDQLSLDNATWAPAPTNPDLHMDWILALADGSPYGPLHILALRDLVKEGSVSLHAKLTNKKTGENRPVGEALVGALVEELAQMQNRLEVLSRKPLPPPPPPAEPAKDESQEQLAQLRRELEESAKSRTGLEAEIRRWQQENEGLQARIAALEQEKDQQARQIETRSREQSDRIDELNRQLAQAQEEKNQQAQALSEAKAFGQELRSQSDELKKQLTELQQQFESSQQTISEMKEAAATLAPAPAAPAPTPAPAPAPSPAVSQNERTRRLQEEEANFMLQKEIQRWKKLYEEERESGKSSNNQLNARLKEMRDNDLVLHTRLEQANLRLKQVEANYGLLQKTMEDGVTDQKLTAYVSALTESFTGLSQNYDNLMKQLADKSDELKSAMDSRAQIQKETQERIEQMEIVVRREQEEADQARLKLAEVERGHFQLVQAYKDLSDRMIRMRQSSAPVARTASEEPSLRETISGRETKSRIKLNR